MQKQTSNRRGISRSFIAAAAALALSAGVTLAQRADRSGPPDRPPQDGDARPDNGPGGAPDRRGRQTPVDLTGVVQSYNLGSHGIPDALMITTDDKMSQVNCPPELGAILSQVAPIGDQVKVKAIAGPKSGDHAVYRFISLTNSKGQQLGGAAPWTEKTVHVHGIVKQINYGRDGEINGAILDSGDLVLVPSESAQQLKFAVGLNLSIDGQARSNVQRVNVIHPQTVNGAPIAAADDDDRQNPGGRPPRGARAGGPPPADDAGGQNGPPRRGSHPDGPPPGGDDQGPPPNR